MPGRPTTPSVLCLAPAVTVESGLYGVAEISIASACRAGQDVTVDYAGATWVVNLDDAGHAALTIDCFAGDRELLWIRFFDKTEVLRLPPPLPRRIAKVAILWTSSVDLDLHAYEFGAQHGDARHVWARHSMAPDRIFPDEPGRNGRGLMTTTSDGREFGTHLEVYTFRQLPDDAGGSIRFAVDFASCGALASPPFCGAGPHAAIAFRVAIFTENRLRFSDAEFASVACGAEIAPSARFNTKLVPELVVRKS